MAHAPLGGLVRYLRTLAEDRAAERLNDGQLLRQFVARHDAAAFEVLVQRHGPLVLRVCQRVLRDAHAVEDAFQATFLVLLRRAASIRKQDALASWLHGVAYRTAVRAKTAAARRQEQESQAPGRPAAEPLAEVTWREVRAVLDEELHRLPERYRAPFVLCYLEGQTNVAAARQLGLPAGSLSKRLARARALLRARLSRRGVTLSTGVLFLLLAETAAGAVPAALGAATTQAAVAFITGGLTNARTAVALAEGVSKAMTMTRLKAAAAVLLAVTLLGAGAGAALHRADATRAPDEPPAATAAAATAEPAGDTPARTDLFGDALPAGAVTRLGTVRLRHPGWSPALAFAPDSKTLLSSNEDKVIRSWDVATGKAVRTLKVAGERSVRAAALSPDGRTLATGGYDGIRLWDPVTGRERRLLQAGSVRALAFTPDGKALISGGDDNAVRVWDLATGEERLRLSWHKSTMSFVAATPDGRTLVAAGDTGKILLADLTTGQELHVLSGQATAVALAPDGKTLAVGAEVREAGRETVSSFARLIDVATGKELRKLGQHEARMRALAFAPDGKTLATSSEDRTVRLWDVATGLEVWKVAGTPDRVQCLTFAPDGKTLTGTDGSAGIIHLWDAATGRPRHPDNGPAGYIRSVVFSRDGKLLAAAAACERAPRVWDVAAAKQVRTLPAHDKDSIYGLVLTPDGRAVVSSGSDATIRFGDLHTGAEVRKFTLPPPVPPRQMHLATSFGLSADGKRLLGAFGGWPPASSYARFRAVYVWDLTTGEMVVRRQGPGPDMVDHPTFSPDGTALAQAAGQAVVLLEVDTGKELRRLPVPDQADSWRPCVFSPDGKLLAVRTYTRKPEGKSSWVGDYKVRVIDLAAGAERLCLDSGDPHGPLAFSPDGTALAVADQKVKVLRLWDLATGKERWCSPELDTPATSLAFSADGRRLASGLYDTTVLVWDLSQVPRKPGR